MSSKTPKPKAPRAATRKTTTTLPARGEQGAIEETRLSLGEILAFDLETQTRLPRGERGWDAFRKMRFSLAGVVNVRTGEFTSYREEDAPRLLRRLAAAALIIGHNQRGFDFAVLAHYEDHQLLSRPNIDLQLVVKARYPNAKYPKLEEISIPTLGRGKAGAGADAPALFQAGDFGSLEKYLEADVRLVADLFLEAERTGKLIAHVEGVKLDVPIDVRPDGHDASPVAEPVKSQDKRRSFRTRLGVPGLSVPLECASCMVLVYADSLSAKCPNCDRNLTKGFRTVDHSNASAVYGQPDTAGDEELGFF